MKKFACILLCALLTLALAAPACADIAYEPDNNFFASHRGQCAYENRGWYTAGENGYTTVYASPKDPSVRTAIPNGVWLYISYTYGDGAWGCVEYDPDTGTNSSTAGGTGWVKLADMVPDYDSGSFRADHKDALEEAEHTLAREEDTTIYAYKYPGSGIVAFALENAFGDDLAFSTVFTDPAGREWGWCGYYYGRQDFWVCLDDPYNGDLPADENYVDPLAEAAPAADAETLAAAAKARMDRRSLYTFAAVGGLAAGVLSLGGALLGRRRRDSGD